ncbi:MAG: response regulator transcription factor [Dehalococcoidia bacterium]|nr:response regulator transcription factor [Dehalococcoidia bacterium]
MSKVLIVDDDKNLLDVLKYNLTNDGLTVVTAEDGIQALERARQDSPDLILLDIMLPGLDGFEVCRILRKEMAVPILMLTAKTEEIDKVVGLELGADDYMTKPFSVRELMARTRAMLRRSQWMEQQITLTDQMPQSVLKADSLEVDVIGHRVLHKGKEMKLSPKEFDLLAFLMRNRGQVFNREQLVEKVWGYDYGGTARTVDVHMRSLRRKIENNPVKPERLITIHGFGYKFEG